VSRQDSLVLDVCETVEKVEAVQFESSSASVVIKGTGLACGSCGVCEVCRSVDGSSGSNNNNNNVQSM
jgi:hypothetical protein